jgi:hypothetical protein
VITGDAPLEFVFSRRTATGDAAGDDFGHGRLRNLWTPEESKVESCEHQDNANIHCQPFPESVSEEREIYTDDDGCHRDRVKHSSYLSAHFSQHSPDDPMLERIIAFF